MFSGKDFVVYAGFDGKGMGLKEWKIAGQKII